jgi:hypothetical protein
VDEECDAPALVAKGRVTGHSLKPAYALLHIELIKEEL